MFIQKCPLTTAQKEDHHKHAATPSLNQLSQVIKSWRPTKKPLLVCYSQKVSGIVLTENVFFLQATITHRNRLTRFSIMTYQSTTLNVENARVRCASFYERLSALCLLRKKWLLRIFELSVSSLHCSHFCLQNTTHFNNFTFCTKVYI